jgi:imidazolonepropionase-like amidohydrolase
MRVFDGTGTALRDGLAVLVEDGRVAAVAGVADVPADAVDVLDLGGRTLLPGLIDAHVHLSSAYPHPEPAEGVEPIYPGTHAHIVASLARDVLRMGITTVRDVGGFGDLIVEVRQAMRYGAFRGPRILTCGRIVSPTAPGGRFFPGMYREADGPDDVRRAVREQLRYGADFVKVMTTGARSVELEDPDPAQLTREELRVLVEEAHRQGYRVAAHCEGLAGTELAVEEGVDTIEHGMYLAQRPDLLERLAADGRVLVPTLSCLYGVAGLGEAVEPTRASDGARGAVAPTWTPLLVELAEHNLEQAALTVKAARRAGVTMAMGFDWKGRNALELLRLIHAGLTPTEALTAATAGSARALGLEDRLGTVVPGRLADLLVVDGDPIEEPALLLDRERIWLVLQLGEPVAGAALESRLDAAIAPAGVGPPVG